MPGNRPEASRARAARVAFVVEAEPIDQRGVLGQAGTAAVSANPPAAAASAVPTSTKPKPRRSSAPGASAFLSKPAARPSGCGKRKPNASTAKTRVAFRDRQRRREAQRRERRAMRVLRRAAGRARAARDRPASSSSREGSEHMTAVGAERQRARPDNGGEIQNVVKMRKQRPAARRLPAQRRPERGGVDRRRARDRRGRRTISPPSPRPDRRPRNGCSRRRGRPPRPRTRPPIRRRAIRRRRRSCI